MYMQFALAVVQTLTVRMTVQHPATKPPRHTNEKTTCIIYTAHQNYMQASF